MFFFYFLKEFLLSDLVTPGFLSKLYREIEILLLNKQNRELFNKKLEVIHAAFANYEGAHIPIWKALIIWKRFRGTLEFESRVNEKFEFNQCDEEWKVSFNA